MDWKKKILNDLRVELSDEFDRNFQRKAFFDKPWPPRKMNGKGSLLMQTGKLRRSIRCRVDTDSVVWETSERYAAIHNYGGVQYVKPHHRRRYSKKKDTYTRHQVKGYAYKMPRRQFLGDHPEVRKRAEAVIQRNLQKAAQDLISKMKKL